MPDFEGQKVVKLQPATRNLPVSLAFAVCSSPTANDGAIPYGSSIASAVVKAYSPAGTEVTSSLVTKAATVSGTTVSCEISYYTGIVAGKYKLTAILTMASGYVDELDCRRVVVSDT